MIGLPVYFLSVGAGEDDGSARQRGRRRRRRCRRLLRRDDCPCSLRRAPNRWCRRRRRNGRRNRRGRRGRRGAPFSAEIGPAASSRGVIDAAFAIACWSGISGSTSSRGGRCGSGQHDGAGRLRRFEHDREVCRRRCPHVRRDTSRPARPPSRRGSASGSRLFSATRTRFTSGPSRVVWAGAFDATFGKSRTSRRGSPPASLTSAGVSRPLPPSVTVVADAVRLARTRSSIVAGGASSVATGTVPAVSGAAVTRSWL